MADPINDDLVGREVACPHCHEQCGWCSDYRWMHGTMSLPGSRRKCTIPGMQPDPVCTVCGGDRRVTAFVSYQRLRPTADTATYEGEQQ